MPYLILPSDMSNELFSVPCLVPSQPWSGQFHYETWKVTVLEEHLICLTSAMMKAVDV